MIFNDGQAFKNMEGDVRAPNVLDNLIDRREIPVMLAVFINPGRRPDQPEPTPQEWGDRTTNRPTEYNTLDDKYARVIVDELLPALTRTTTSRRIPSTAASAAPARAPSPPSPSRGSARTSSARSSASSAASRTCAAATRTPDIVRKSEKKPIRIFLQDGRNDNRGRGGAESAPTTRRRDWFLQNVRLMQALTEKGYDVNYAWGIGRHGQKQGGAIFPDMMRWLWRDHPVSTDPNDTVERSFNAPKEKK